MGMLGLIAGLTGLWLGTEITVRGAVSIANRLRISEFVVGIVILSVGSDLPELAIAIDAAITTLQGSDASAVVVGSALGSALGQIGFVLGIAGLIGHLTLPKLSMFQHGAVLLGSLFLVGIFGSDGTVSRYEGIFLVTVYAAYLGSILWRTPEQTTQHTDAALALPRTLLYLFVGIGAVTVAADLTVSSVAHVARALNVEDSVIAAVFIGLGTSLPELSISVGAALKRRSRMSVGNIIGSNVFDTLVPIGVAATIVNIGFDRKWLLVELPLLLLLSTIAVIMFATRKGIHGYRAGVFLGIYGVYILLRITNSS